VSFLRGFRFRPKYFPRLTSPFEIRGGRYVSHLASGIYSAGSNKIGIKSQWRAIKWNSFGPQNIHGAEIYGRCMHEYQTK